MKVLTLNNSVNMPVLGFGTLTIRDPEEGRRIISKALEVGFRAFDTAASYKNEDVLGETLYESGVPRSELFITSKLRISDATYEKAHQAFELTLNKLRTDYLDLYLIHHPLNDYYGAWRAMCELYKQGKIRAIGVSNFTPDRMLDFILNNEMLPAVNQLEVHPYHQQAAAQEQLREHNIQMQSWGPFAQGKHDVFKDETLVRLGRKHGKTAAQIILRWLVQRDIQAIPKAASSEHIRENFEIFDFELSDSDMSEISRLDQGKSAQKARTDPEFVRFVIDLHRQ